MFHLSSGTCIVVYLDLGRQISCELYAVEEMERGKITPHCSHYSSNPRVCAFLGLEGLYLSLNYRYHTPEALSAVFIIIAINTSAI